MNLKAKVLVGVVVTGLMCGGGYAQASEPVRSVDLPRSMLMADSSTGAGILNSAIYSGVVDLNSPGSVRDINSHGSGTEHREKSHQSGATDAGQGSSSGPGTGTSTEGAKAPHPTSGNSSGDRGK